VSDATTPRSGPIFLSYSRTDRDAAIAIRNGLTRAGLEVFHDLDALHAGDDWMARLQEALATCSAFIVLVGADGVRRWVGAEVQVAINRRIAAILEAERLPIYPVMLRGTPPSSLPPFLALFQAAAWSPEEPLPGELVEAIRRHAGSRPVPRPFDGCPFLGLSAFQAKDAHLFFGRGQETLDALGCIGNQQDLHPDRSRGGSTAHHRWLQIEGNSGSGKSSLVSAGLLPMIDRGGLWARTGYDEWRVLGPMRPGADPLEKLAEVVERGLVADTSARHSLARLEGMTQNERALALALRDGRGPDMAFLLVVDQFEELFTVADEDRRALFDAQLAHAIEDPACPLYLVTTVRSDFLDRFEQIPRLQSASNRSCKRYFLPTISEEGLREVIERPAAMAELDVREVTGAILEDARDEVGALPLVENALFVLWSAREGNRLTAAQYRKLNGLAGMLSSQADRLLDQLDRDVPGGKAAALELLLRLTRVNPDGRHTRQRITRGEAVFVAGDGDAAKGERVVRTLSGEVDAGVGPSTQGGALRLVMTWTERIADSAAPVGVRLPGDIAEEHYVDLIHETLIRFRQAVGRTGRRIAFWPTLSEYIDKNRDRDLDRQQLRRLAEQWSARRGAARWRDLPGWSDLRRYRKLRTPAGGLDARFLSYSIRAARLRMTAWGLAAVIVGIAAESYLWVRQEVGLVMIKMDPYFRSESLPRFPLVYMLHRPLWLMGYVPTPEFVNLSGGVFRMGCVPDMEKDAVPCWEDEVHPDPRVSVGGPLWMSLHPVTFREYDAYVFHRWLFEGEPIPYPEGVGSVRDDRAVVDVDWNRSIEYARWLGTRIGRSCRLPTEAEWEYAARAGRSTAIPDGENPWGLRGMLGGVAEWVADAYGPYRSASSPDPKPEPASDADRVVRGDLARQGPHPPRVYGRDFLQPAETGSAVGFRVVCTPTPK